jgi:hypothetical protein
VQWHFNGVPVANKDERYVGSKLGPIAPALSGTLIVAYRSTPSQPSDDFNEFLLRLVPMLDLVALRGLPSTHFGKQLHRVAGDKQVSTAHTAG